ncbi:hypothetical protein Taro_029944 [Colocasia esculenta]|uniref:Uncharacterized protein n=1 Tax=Colocasia esculenta TaxID=4460 RepID=A0A843VQI0_COLES|nr:hypothetical protein [Colocasia esculenta]
MPLGETPAKGQNKSQKPTRIFSLRPSGSVPEETTSLADKPEHLVKLPLVLAFNMKEFKSPSSKRQMFKSKKMGFLLQISTPSLTCLQRKTSRQCQSEGMQMTDL